MTVVGEYNCLKKKKKKKHHASFIDILDDMKLAESDHLFGDGDSTPNQSTTSTQRDRNNIFTKQSLPQFALILQHI